MVFVSLMLLPVLPITAPAAQKASPRMGPRIGIIIEAPPLSAVESAPVAIPVPLLIIEAPAEPNAFSLVSLRVSASATVRCT